MTEREFNRPKLRSIII